MALKIAKWAREDGNESLCREYLALEKRCGFIFAEDPNIWNLAGTP